MSKNAAWPQLAKWATSVLTGEPSGTFFQKQPSNQSRGRQAIPLRFFAGTESRSEKGTRPSKSPRRSDRKHELHESDSFVATSHSQSSSGKLRQPLALASAQPKPAKTKVETAAGGYAL